ncbi:MAG TPA: M56 family metallopeptidase [Luteitalea sp.]|nr:M56 family metallopeptidase [Luteitalea sp.]
MLATLASVGSVVPVLLVRMSVLLLLAWAVQRVLGRRASAAVRHLVWSLALGGVLLLPIVTAIVPSWTLEIRRIATPAATVPFASPVADATPIAPLASLPRAEAIAPAPAAPVVPEPSSRINPLMVVGAIYLAGVALVLAHVLRQRWQLWHVVRASTPVADGGWLELIVRCAAVMGVRDGVRLLRSRHMVPMTCGTWRPTIVIPAVADTWDQERREAVLLHELAHVVRKDCLTQLVASLACAVAWCHPAAWWVARRMRHERELACDDRVVSAGTPARGYAGHLLDIAYAFTGDHAPAHALAMARPRQLESRMRALLDPSRDRRPAGGIRAGLLTIAAATVLVPLGAFTATVVAVAPDSVVVPVRAQAESTATAPVASARELTTLTGLRAQLQATQPLPAAVRDEENPNLPGTWEVRLSETQGRVHLRMTQGRSSNGHTVDVTTFTGLADALRTTGTPAKFQLKRDAGTFLFEGLFRDGVGAGTYTFTADSSFPDALAKRGFARPTAIEQYKMARHDVGFALIDALAEQGYGKPQTADLIKAGQHGVSATYVKEMASLGYKLGALDALITLRDHGVTASYVRELGELGYKGLSADEVRKARDHGITPDYVRGMTTAGYASLPMADLIRARDHGVTPDYVRGLNDAGYRGLPLEEAIRVRDHGVNAEYLAAMKTHGYTEPIAKLVQARDHGISADYVKEMAELGYARTPLDLLIRMRDHGISVGYVRELKALGYEKIAPDDLVTLRDHGFSADRIKRVNSRSGSKLPVPALIEALRQDGR